MWLACLRNSWCLPIVLQVYLVGHAQAPTLMLLCLITKMVPQLLLVRNEKANEVGFQHDGAVLCCCVVCRYAYVVPCCPKGLRRAVVLLRGRGTGPGSNAAMAALAAGSNGSGSSSSGTGGVQFACAQLSFIRNDEIQGIAAEDCLAGWQDRVVHGF